jgi:hypothetical protein
MAVSVINSKSCAAHIDVIDNIQSMIYIPDIIIIPDDHHNPDRHHCHSE